STAISGNRARSEASGSQSASGGSQTPTSPRARRASRCAFQEASGTINGSSAGSVPGPVSRTRVQRSSTIAPSLMSRGIDTLPERLDAEAVHGVAELLVFVPALDVDLDEPGDDLGDGGGRERGPYDPAQRGLRALFAADRHLVPLLAVLVDAEDADVADMMVPAGVHAAGNVHRQRPEVMEVVEIVEAALDGFGNRDRLGVGKRAEVATRAADDVGQQADVRRGEAQRLELAPQGKQG